MGGGGEGDGGGGEGEGGGGDGEGGGGEGGSAGGGDGAHVPRAMPLTHARPFQWHSRWLIAGDVATEKKDSQWLSELDALAQSEVAP